VQQSSFNTWAILKNTDGLSSPQQDQTMSADSQTQETQKAASQLTNYSLIRRNGSVVAFEPQKISVALMKAFLAVKGSQAAASASTRQIVSDLTTRVVNALTRSRPSGGIFHIEDVQDQVELQLMRQEHHDVARSYVLYREQRAKARAVNPEPRVKINIRSGDKVAPFNEEELRAKIKAACDNLDDDIVEDVDANKIMEETVRNLYDGVSVEEVDKATILATRTLIEFEPAYTKVASNLLNTFIFDEVTKELDVDSSSCASRTDAYRQSFIQGIKRAVKVGLLDPRLAKDFDLQSLSLKLDVSQDYNFDYLGLQTLYDRYFLHVGGKRIEMPQSFFMRIAMGLSLNETNKNERAVEFYQVLASFDFMSSTPTLFNSGTVRPQLSSCYLSTVPDDLDGIYEAIKDNAMLSKFAGGLGNDWTRVRALGSHIKGTNGESQGVVPFLKVVNDTAVAVNQGGKRKGAVCTYLETWHLDIEEFLELRKNTGDDRRRTHDMNTANWIPDLFMKRVINNETWTLFTPSTCPDLHDLYGKDFQVRYEQYERMAANGELKPYKTIGAVDLWRKMLNMLFETSHPWITWKDPSNIRNPQQHVGVVHSSNLCTEITLNTNDSEIAVCNLGSINLAQHLTRELQLDEKKIEKTVTTAMRMLDNVIDLNYYAVKKAYDSNLRHRPVGLGMMGFQDALYKKGLPYNSREAMEFADVSCEVICYYAYKASSDLAAERGAYSTFKGSLWDRGILPIDSLDLLEKDRNVPIEVPRTSTMNWDLLRESIRKHGMRNSNCTAIAPTATISNITGVEASIEPSFGNLSVKSNLSGDFTVVNKHLVNDLKRLGIWDTVMLNDLKYFEGSLQNIDRIPDEIKGLYVTAFEIEPQWLIEAAARRQKWIDQSQSLNIYMANTTGPKLDNTYKLAWKRGLKTTYYLRTLGATSAEKSTIASGNLNAVAFKTEGQDVEESAVPGSDVKVCMLNNPDCESCQ
jgi:ribonucleoside-diphosphate reductase alpha chain